MTELKIKVSGIEQLQGKFAQAARTSPGEFDKSMGKWARQIVGKLRDKGYPPQRPGQTYKRTRRLKQSYEAKRDSSLNWTIGNKANYRGTFYASYVVGDNQAWMHKGRWWKARDVIAGEFGKLEKTLVKDIERLLF